jgi:TPR repeat protein
LAGTGIPKNADEAFLWFQRAAAQGNMEAVNLAGRCLEHGWGTEVDVRAAAAQYHRAAEAGDTWAQYNLGHLYLDGIGVVRDVHQAFSYYLRAAVQGHSRAMNLVGRCCEEGWGTAVDFGAAAGWYRRSAEAGYFRGQYNWASVLMNANRDAEAVSWFECAAAHGTPAVRAAALRIIASAASPAGAAALANRLRADTPAESS